MQTDLHHNSSGNTQDDVHAQAVLVEALLPRITRHLFTIGPTSFTAELPIGQIRVCMTLMKGPLTLTELSEEMNASVSAATQIADRMEKAGLVVRVVGTEDRRVRYLQLSEHGMQAMLASQKDRVFRTEQALASLSEQDRIQLLSLMEKMMEAVLRTEATDQELPHA